MVSQSKNGFPKYGFSIKKWFPKYGFSIKKWFPNQKMVPIPWFSIILWHSSRGLHHIYKNIMIYMSFQNIWIPGCV